MVRMLVDHPAVDTAPRWSKDGAWIGFIARRSDRAAASIVRSDGLGVPIQVSHGPAGMDDHDLTWGHVPDRLAYARRVVDGDKRGDHIFSYNVATGETKQVTTRIVGRHSLQWSPDRAQIAHVSDEAEWNHIAVVNADNSAGWNLASEAGDKSQPRWSSDGQRFVYVRTQDGVARCCERASSSSTAELCDPGDGTVSAPRLLPDKRVLYAFTPATGPTRLIVQQPKADAERTELPLAVTWETDRELITPHHLELEINGRRTGALRYQTPETEGAVPVVIVLRDRPDRPRTARLDLLEQALAAHRVTVIVPTLVGSPGYGSKLSGPLAELTGAEAEVLDLLGLIDAIKSIGGVDRGRIAVVGEGAGGTLALLLTGSRPGTIQAVAAVDPVCDWNIELDSGDEAVRAWMLKTYGLPATSPGVYALRTPSTFAGVIDAPLLLVGTDRVSPGRAAQLDALTGLLRDLDVDFEQDVAVTEPGWQTYRRLATFVVDHLREAASDPAPTGEATTPDAV
jgi:dipeptidyl aminopeptidase/acylaminoacyl peptidase